VAACSTTENKISPADIKVTWYFNKWTTYHTLTFDDSTVSVDNNVDTVFTLSYGIKDNSLVTVTQYGNKMMVNKINKLTVLDGYIMLKKKENILGRKGSGINNTAANTPYTLTLCARRRNA